MKEPKDCLEALYNAAEEHHVMMCGGIIMQDSYGVRSVWRKKTIREFCRNQMVKAVDYPSYSGHYRYLIRTDMIRQNNIYYPEYRRFQDPPFIVKAIVCAGEFYGLDKEVYVYRIGHKEVKYSMETSIDILHGIRDVFRLAKENNLRRLYDEFLENIATEYIIPFYKYSFCGNKEIDIVIKEINDIVSTWIGDKERIILTKEKVDRMKADCREEYERVKEIFGNNREKIFYGAGMKVRAYIGRHRKEMKNVLGVAVTSQGVSEEMIEDFSVKQIEAYLPDREKAIVVIGTIPVYQEEIEQNLMRLGFQHIVKADMRKIDLAEEFREEPQS